MKTTKFLASLVLGFAVVACGATPEEATEAAEGEQVSEAAAEEAPAEKTVKDYTPSAKELNDVSYLVGINFGSFIKGYNFGDLNFAQIKKGIEDFLKAEGNPRDEHFGEQFRVNPDTMNEMFNTYLENRHQLQLLVNKEAEDKFLAANLKKDGVCQTASGLQYRIVNAGNEVKPAATDTVWVNYKGALIDGTVFDQTEEGAEPVRFLLNRVVSGWTEGLQLIGEGGEIELYVPAKLGYGERGTQGIEPNSTLIFNISLSKVGKVAPKEDAE